MTTRRPVSISNFGVRSIWSNFTSRSVYFMYFGLPLELGWIIKIHGSRIHRRLLKHTSNYKTLKAVFSSVNSGTLFFDPRLAYLTWLRVQRPRSEFFLLVEWQKATSFHLWKMPTPNSIVPNFTFSCWSIVQKLWEQNARRVKNPEKENQSRTTVDKCKSHVNCGYRLVYLFIYLLFQFLYQIYLVVNIMQIHYL